MMNSEFHHITEEFNVKLQYGEFVGNKWLAIGGPEHSVVQKIIKEIQEIPKINEFDVYILGGILEDWVTLDLDVVLTGEFKPNYLRRILREIVKIGFDNQFYIDVVFKKELWRIDLMTPENHQEESGWVWEYSSLFKQDDEVIQKFKYYPEYGIFKRFYWLPFPKHIEKINSGYRYKKPVQIVVKREI